MMSAPNVKAETSLHKVPMYLKGPESICTLTNTYMVLAGRTITLVVCGYTHAEVRSYAISSSIVLPLIFLRQGFSRNLGLADLVRCSRHLPTEPPPHCCDSHFSLTWGGISAHRGKQGEDTQLELTPANVLLPCFLYSFARAKLSSPIWAKVQAALILPTGAHWGEGSPHAGWCPGLVCWLTMVESLEGPVDLVTIVSWQLRIALSCYKKGDHGCFFLSQHANPNVWINQVLHWNDWGQAAAKQKGSFLSQGLPAPHRLR